jgi:hypothetical protein
LEKKKKETAKLYQWSKTSHKKVVVDSLTNIAVGSLKIIIAIGSLKRKQKLKLKLKTKNKNKKKQNKKTMKMNLTK